MNTEVIVKIGNESWSKKNIDGNISGETKVDSEYLNIVVNTLTNALEQAKFELESSTL